MNNYKPYEKTWKDMKETGHTKYPTDNKRILEAGLAIAFGIILYTLLLALHH